VGSSRTARWIVPAATCVLVVSVAPVRGAAADNLNVFSKRGASAVQPVSAATSQSSPGITEFPVPNSDPSAITVGPDGNLWFAEVSGNNVGKITPQGNITQYPAAANGEMNDITVGPDGNLWFTQRAPADALGKISTSGGSPTPCPVPPSGSAVTGITKGPDGNLWFTDFMQNVIGRVSPDCTGNQQYTIPTANAWPQYITVGPDGNLWFTEEVASAIGVISPSGVFQHQYNVAAGSNPLGITTDPNGNIWFTEEQGNGIGKITPDRTLTEYPVPTPNSQPSLITVGPDGNIWFTEQAGNHIARLNPATCLSPSNCPISEFALPNANSDPYGITTGPDGNIWFTEKGGNRIGRAIPSDLVPVTKFVTPDIKVIQYIHPLDAKQCARDLVAQLGVSKPSALAACGFLSVSANPLPPPRIPDDQTWTAFVNSKEYRGYIHIPPLTVNCSGGEVAAIDNIPVGGPGLHGLILPGFEHSLGYTPPRPFEGLTDYSPAEPFVTDKAGTSVADLMNNDGVFEVTRPGGNALITYMTASRIATVERVAAFPILGFDAPYIWTVTQLRVNCQGDESVSIANSEFPTTNLYINGQLVRFYRQTDLPQFIKDGGTKLNDIGVGYLALDPTCGTNVHWGTKALLGQPDPGGCFLDILNGPTGGVTGLDL